MHIPDGYLSPSTCAVLYAGSAPFWFVALRRVKRALDTTFVPLLSVFAAFSFVVMMFNLPLPGGTTGHAVGMGVASIVLGPWASVLAISVALITQALLFGDGGITAIGANCFNMAIIGSLASYSIYRAIGFRASLFSPRRVVAAAIAGYAAINLAALSAAIEFGIQPLLYVDGSGVPLYCPYPLSISIPAMMAGHLTIAGLAELVITAGLVAYLQRSDPSLLRLTAPDAPSGEWEAAPVPLIGAPPRWSTRRKLWTALACLLVLTPIGIIAAGTAWGEWSASDFADPKTRSEIAASSGHRTPPERPPSGLERLSRVWTAPLARYAPPFIPNAPLGYMVSAFAGVAIVLIATGAAVRILAGSRFGFMERSLHHLALHLDRSLSAEETARAPGLLQSLDPRVKLAGMLSLVLAAILVQSLRAELLLGGIALALALSSRLPLGMLARRAWLPALSFSGPIAIPALFLVPGSAIAHVPWLGWNVTAQGLASTSLLMARVFNAASLSALVVLSTEWTRILRALRFLHVPVVLVVILGMSHRYVFLLLRVAREMLESRQSRLIGTLAGAESRRLAAATVGVLLNRSLQLTGEIHQAMQSRGFTGEVQILEEPRIRFPDWIFLALFVTVGAGFAWLGR